MNNIPSIFLLDCISNGTGLNVHLQTQKNECSMADFMSENRFRAIHI